MHWMSLGRNKSAMQSQQPKQQWPNLSSWATLRCFWLVCTGSSVDRAFSIPDAFFFHVLISLSFAVLPSTSPHQDTSYICSTRTFRSSRGQLLFWSHSTRKLWLRYFFSFGLCLPALPSYSNSQTIYFELSDSGVRAGEI